MRHDNVKILNSCLAKSDCIATAASRLPYDYAGTINL